MNASLRELVLAVRYGDASLVGESVGYIILGAADRAASVPRRADVDSILLTGEGEVAIDAMTCTEEDSERSLRSLLKSLLGLVRSHCPNLERVAQRPGSTGLAHLIVELEAALVPVNRKAARRSISRLVREARRSAARAHRGALVAPVLPETWSTPQPAERLGPHLDSLLEESSAPSATTSPVPPAPAEDEEPPRSLPPQAEEWESEGEGAPLPVAGFVAAVQGSGAQTGAQLATPPEEAERGRESGDDRRTDALDEQRELGEGAWGATSVFCLQREDELDQAETQLRAPVAPVLPPRPTRPVAMFLHAGLGELPADLPLIAPARGETPFRPSDMAELLSSQGSCRSPSSSLYQGLKRLSQLDAQAAPVEVGEPNGLPTLGEGG